VASEVRAGRLLKKLKTDEPAHRTDFEQLRQRLDSAFVGASFWRPFVRDAHQVGSNRLSNWLNSNRANRRGAVPPTRPLDAPPRRHAPHDLADGRVLHPIRDFIHPRRYALKNRERTNRMLMLMLLHANRQDNERTYAKNIRQWLKANGGRPRGTRRDIVDADGVPSLR